MSTGKPRKRIHFDLSAAAARGPSAPEKSLDGCWVDIYDGPYFTGRLRRLRGPAVFRQTAPNDAQSGSMIVGPDAMLVRLDNPHGPVLEANQIVPDLAKARLAGKLTSFKLQRRIAE